MTETAIAEAGYGSEQNYEYLEGKGVEAFVKYSYFDREQQKSHQKKHPFEQADYTTMPLATSTSVPWAAPCATSVISSPPQKPGMSIPCHVRQATVQAVL